MKDNITPPNRPFYDDLHFPRGIARSGHFTKSEAEYLIDYGVRLQQLASRQVEPETEDEALFVAIVTGQSNETQYSARLWLKYADAIDNTKHRVSAFGHAYVRNYPPANTELDLSYSA